MKILQLVLAALVGSGATLGVVRLDCCRSDVPAREPSPSLPPSALPAKASVRSEPEASGPIQVAGLMVQRPLRAEVEYGESMPFMGSFARTRLALELVRPEGGIVGLRHEACVLRRFADERGTSLLATDDQEDPIEMLFELAPDGCSLAFYLASKSCPSPGARRLEAEGEIEITVASETAVETSETVALVAGTSLEVGAYAFELGEVGASSWGGGWSLEVLADRDLEGILSWSLVDESGREVELHPRMSWSGMGRWSQSLEADQPLERAALRLKYWSDARSERVPFRVSAELGMQ